MTTAAAEDRVPTEEDPMVAEADQDLMGPQDRMGPAEDPGPADMPDGAARTLNA
jgi:hypothetical protein